MLKPNRNPCRREYSITNIYVEVASMKFFRYRAWPGILVLFCLLAGLIAPAPLPGIEGQAYAAGGPDLVIESITWSPQTPAIGNLMTFTVKVKNQGDDLAGRSRILFFIDNDIADSAFIAQVYPGGAV